MHLFPAGAGQVVSIHAPAWGATNAFAFRAYNYIVFQSTHPRGVRPIQSGNEGLLQWFQSTHPRGVRLGRIRACTCTVSFQSTHPRGVRLFPFVPKETGRDVSIHAPAWGATPSPPPIAARRCVSIHAPAWGATDMTREWITLQRVSIHAPAWGATGRPEVRHAGLWCFNPRTRVGCDAMRTNRYRRFFEVSIHAPAWGATCPISPKDHLRCVSIHAPAWGATLEDLRHAPARTRFQSTHPRGVRLTLLRSVPITTFGFNPRTRVGCDYWL